VPLRIGFDLDGVFADMEGELHRQATIVFGEPMTRRLEHRSEAEAETAEADASEMPLKKTARATPPAVAGDPSTDNVPVVTRIGMTPRQERRLWRHVESIENFWQTLEELETGVIARLAALTAERRWEIIFLTKRPETVGVTAQLQSQRWLVAKGFPLPSVFVVQGSRGRIAASLGLDLVVDDRPENCLDVVVDSKARAILVWRDDESRLPAAAKRLGIGMVKSVGECLDILTQVDSAAARDQPGVMDRVKRLLGLKEPASA
jgi:hypothetical protein